MEAYGLHIDDLQKLRVLEPGLSSDSEHIKDECETFVQSIADFRKMADSLIEITDKVIQNIIFVNQLCSIIVE